MLLAQHLEKVRENLETVEQGRPDCCPVSMNRACRGAEFPGPDPEGAVLLPPSKSQSAFAAHLVDCLVFTFSTWRMTHFFLVILSVRHYSYIIVSSTY